MFEMENKAALDLLNSFLLYLGLNTRSTLWVPGENKLYCADNLHTIWRACGELPEDMAADLDIDALFMRFEKYVKMHNAIPGAVEFEPYSLNVYSCSCGCGAKFLYAAVYR